MEIQIKFKKYYFERVKYLNINLNSQYNCKPIL